LEKYFTSIDAIIFIVNRIRSILKSYMQSVIHINTHIYLKYINLFQYFKLSIIKLDIYTYNFICVYVNTNFVKWGHIVKVLFCHFLSYYHFSMLIHLELFHLVHSPVYTTIGRNWPFDIVFFTSKNLKI